MRIKLTNLEGEKYYLNIDAILTITQNGNSAGSILYLVEGKIGLCRESIEEVNGLCNEVEIANRAILG